MTATTADVKALESLHVLQTYKRLPVVFERGSGTRLFDEHGRAYLDFISGIGVASLGHGHAGLAHALGDQAATLAHTSNLYFHPLQGELAARLAKLTGLDRAFFCNSGTEAVEACLKLARRFWHTRGDQQRTKFVAFTHSFHGRTMGSLSVTWDPHYRGPFEPLIPGVSFASTSDLAEFDRLVDGSTAAVIVEPIQGEGGVRPISGETARAIAAACARTGALLIADEVQSGSGRTGQFLYSPAIGLKPDLIALGKALGGGMPVGVAMLSETVAGAVSAGDHGTTYGGNLLACRAALVVLDELERGLQASIRRVSAHLFAGLAALRTRHAAIVDVRGAGLMAGIEMTGDAAPLVTAALERGLLVNRTALNVIRLLPPYVIGEADIDEGLAMLDDAIGFRPMTDLTLRTATDGDAEVLHALIRAHALEGHLLPRELEELRLHAHRFVVCDVAGTLMACAELAPLSGRVAEVRSLVVTEDFRRIGLAARLVGELRRRATAAGFDMLCAFTHDARFFVRQDFSIVPHTWLPEKIATDCAGCPLFRQCGQYAMVMSLREVSRFAAPARTRRLRVA